MMANKQIIKCPFYERKALGGEQAYIICDNLLQNLGFDMTTRLQFVSKTERNDYFELFCTDKYTCCPYYKATMYLQECVEKEKRERILRNGKTKRT